MIMKWVFAALPMIGACTTTGVPSDIPRCSSTAGPSEVGTWNRAPLSVPIKITGDGDNDPRFTVSVQIGDSDPIDVLLDTGSAGLRIPQGLVPDSSYQCASDVDVTAGFGTSVSNAQVQGVSAMAVVSIAGVATQNAIPVMLIEDIGCSLSDPNCYASGESVSSYPTFAPDKAIMGVGMRTTAEQIGNPIAQLPGQPTFIIEAPTYGGTTGTLLIGPTSATTARFSTSQLAVSNDVALANGTPSWTDDENAAACVDDQTGDRDFCFPSLWDTGTPAVIVEWSGDTDSGSSTIASGSNVEFTVGPTSAPLEQFGFTVGPKPLAGLDQVVISPTTGTSLVILGTELFFRYDAWFDQVHGVTGLAAKQ